MPETEKIYNCPADDVIVPEDRVRQEFKKKDLDELVESIKDKGVLQAGVCRIGPTGEIILVAGERRLKACELAEVNYKYTLSNETDPFRILEIELEENLRRVNLTFQEEAEGVERLHAIEQEIHGATKFGASGGHGVKDTAQLLGKAVGTVQEDLEIAAFLEFDEVRNARNKTEAKKVIKRLKEEYVQGEALRKARAKEDTEAGVVSTEIPEGLSDTEKAAIEFKEKVNYFSTRVVNDKMEDTLLNEDDNQYSVVFFDPPWGVDFDNVSEKNGSKEMYKDSPEEFRKRLSGWLSLLYRKMAENSHLYMFFGIVNYEFVYTSLEAAGFTTNRMPIIWYKQGAHRTRTPDVWPGRSYEPIAYARKGSKILIRKGAPDVAITPAPTPTMKKSHPSAKHPDVYIDLIKRSCIPGDKILDPMCGSGMLGVAAETLRNTHQLDWKMIEEKETFANLALTNVVMGYHHIVNVDITVPEEPLLPYYICYGCYRSGMSTTLLIDKKSGKQRLCPKCQSGVFLKSESLSEDFKTLEPGSDEWKAYWELYPEKQNDMLIWKKEKNYAR